MLPHSASGESRAALNLCQRNLCGMHFLWRILRIGKIVFIKMFSAPDVFLKAKIKLNILGAVLFAFKIGYLANIYFGMQLKEIIFLGIYFLQQAMAVAIQEILCADRTATRRLADASRSA